MKVFFLMLIGTLVLLAGCSDEPTSQSNASPNTDNMSDELPIKNKRDKNYLAAKKVVDKGCREGANTEAENKYCDCQFEVLHYNLSKSIGKTYYKKPIMAEDEKKYDDAGNQVLELCSKFAK